MRLGMGMVWGLVDPEDGDGDEDGGGSGGSAFAFIIQI